MEAEDWDNFHGIFWDFYEMHMGFDGILWALMGFDGISMGSLLDFMEVYGNLCFVYGMFLGCL